MFWYRFRSSAITCFAVLTVAYAASGAHAQNLLLTNPDFESPGTGYSDSDPNGIPGWYVPYNPNYSYYGISNDIKPNQSGFQFTYFEATSLQTAPANRAVVVGGVTYNLAANVRGGDNTPGEPDPSIANSSPITLSIVFYDATGNAIVSPGSSISISLPATSSSDPWNTYAFDAIAPDGAVSAGATITDPYGAFSGHTIFADDFVLTASVPEPACLGLASMAIAGLGIRRRRAHKTII